MQARKAGQAGSGLSYKSSKFFWSCWRKAIPGEPRPIVSTSNSMVPSLNVMSLDTALPLFSRIRDNICDCKAYLVGLAVHRRIEWLEEQFLGLSYEPYAAVHSQLHCILREVNTRRKLAQFVPSPLPASGPGGGLSGRLNLSSQRSSIGMVSMVFLVLQYAPKAASTR